jgi:transposase-like protein
MLSDIIDNVRKGPNGRRYFRSEQKALIVSEWEKSDLSGPEFCRRYGLIVTMLYKWRKDSMRGAKMSIQNEGELYTKNELEVLRNENQELKEALADAIITQKILKKKLELDEQRHRLKRFE